MRQRSAQHDQFRRQNLRLRRPGVYPQMPINDGKTDRCVLQDSLRTLGDNKRTGGNGNDIVGLETKQSGDLAGSLAYMDQIATAANRQREKRFRSHGRSSLTETWETDPIVPRPSFSWLVHFH